MIRRNKPISQVTHEAIVDRLRKIINGPASAGGYRTVWHSLELEGIRVPRAIVQSILKELDPVGSENRRQNRLQRRTYVNPGPNSA